MKKTGLKNLDRAIKKTKMNTFWSAISRSCPNPPEWYGYYTPSEIVALHKANAKIRKVVLNNALKKKAAGISNIEHVTWTCGKTSWLYKQVMHRHRIDEEYRARLLRRVEREEREKQEIVTWITAKST